MSSKTMIVSGSSNSALARLISKNSGIDLMETHLSQYPNQELQVRVSGNTDMAILVQSFSYPVNSHIIETLLLADALRRNGADNIVGVIPWFGYSKQDKVFLPGEPLSAKVIAKTLQTAHLTKIITLDLHNPSIAGYFDIPVRNLTAMPVFIQVLQKKINTNTIVVSPDAGSIKSSNTLAINLDVDVAHIAKTRDLHTGEVTVSAIDKDISGKEVIIFDDMIATGSTLINTSKFLSSKGAQKITVCATHHLFIKGVQTKLDKSPIDSLYITDTIPKPDGLDSDMIKVLTIAPLVAEAL